MLPSVTDPALTVSANRQTALTSTQFRRQKIPRRF